jgi:hypothetical protein
MWFGSCIPRRTVEMNRETAVGFFIVGALLLLPPVLSIIGIG